MRNGYLALLLLIVGVQTAVAETSELPTDSIYRIKSVWTSSKESQLRLSSFSGKPTLIAMVYTHCQSVCPVVVETMKRIELKVGSKIHYVLVTLDCNRDSPKVLSQFADLHDLQSPPWTLLNGSVEQTRELSVALQLKQSQEANGEFIHTNAIIALDSRGRIKGSHPGGGDLAPILSFISPQ